MNKIEKTIFGWDVGMAVCTGRVVEMKKDLPFCREFSTLYIEEKLLLTLFPKFKREATLKNSAFWWAGCLTHNVLWSYLQSAKKYSETTKRTFAISKVKTLIPPTPLNQFYESRVGQNRETNEELDEDCIEEWIQFDRVKVNRDGEGGREALGIGNCSINIWDGSELE